MAMTTKIKQPNGLPTPAGLTLDSPMGLVKFGGYGAEYVLPWDAAVQLLTIMKDATPVGSFYEEGKSGYRIQARTSVEFRAFMPEEQASMLMSGGPL